MPQHGRSLPKRQPYRIAKVELSVDSEDAIRQRVIRAAMAPEPPSYLLNHRGLIDYIKSLRDHADKALLLLANHEPRATTEAIEIPQKMRIKITVYGTAGQVLGSILADGSAFGPQGQRITAHDR